MPTRVSRRMVLGAAALVAVVVGVSWVVVAASANDEPRIRDWQPGTGGGIALDDTKGGVSYTFDDATVCLTGPGSVVVEQVEVVRPTGGLQVSKFSFRPTRQGRTYNYVTDPHQRLADVGFPEEGPMVVDRQCTEDGSLDTHAGSTLMGVEVVKHGLATATGAGFVIGYRSGNKQYKVYVPLGIVLCSGKIEEHPECKEHPELRPP